MAGGLGLVFGVGEPLLRGRREARPLGGRGDGGDYKKSARPLKGWPHLQAGPDKTPKEKGEKKEMKKTFSCERREGDKIGGIWGDPIEVGGLPLVPPLNKIDPYLKGGLVRLGGPRSE